MPTYTYEDVVAHNQNSSCWLIIHENVYDVTSFKDHPGGYEKLVSARGINATDGFDEVSEHHADPRVEEKMRIYYEGDIDMSTVPVKSSYDPRKAYMPITPRGNIPKNEVSILSTDTISGHSNRPGNNPREYTRGLIIVFLFFLAFIFSQLFGNKKK